MIFEIDIEDKFIIEYLDKIDDDNIDKCIEKILKLGITVIESANLSIDNEKTFSKLIDPIQTNFNKLENKLNSLITDENNSFKEKIDTVFNSNNPMMKQMDILSRTIEDFKGSSKTPILKGQIGEKCIWENLEKYFPESEIKNMTKQAHQADFHLYMKDSPTILIEVKTYKNNVPTEQVNKFKSDLLTSGLKAGILVSTLTGISRKKTFDWEILDDRILVYIPNSGLDAYSVTWGILFIKELCKFKSNNIEISKIYEITSKLDILRSLIVDIENIKNIISRTKYNLVNNLESSLSNLDNELKSIDIKIKSFISYFKL
jgi:hypothetical protein